MGGAAIFKGARTGLLSSKGLSLKDGSIVDNDGVPNFIKNGHAEINTTGWATYADAAGAAPVDGTGGSANITWTRSTTTPLAGSGSFLFTKDAANRQGQGASYDFTVDPAFQARVINIQFDYLVSSGTFVAGTSSADSDVTVWIYDVTNSTLIQPSSYKLLSNSTTISDTFQASFQTSATGTSYRLILHCATTSASAYTLKLDNFQVTPTEYAFGTPVTDWIAYTPTFTGFGSPTNVNFVSRRVGDTLEVKGTFTNGTPTATEGRISFGYGGKDSNVTSVSTLPTLSLAGKWVDSANGSTTDFRTRSVLIEASKTYFTFGAEYASVTGGSLTKQNGNAVSAASTNISIFASVQIQGFSSSVQMSDQTSTRVIAAKYNGATATLTSSLSKVTFTTKAIDDTNSYSSGTYTVPVAGKYKVSASILITRVLTVSSNNLQIVTYKNGALQSGNIFRDQSTEPQSRSVLITDILDCKAGDTIEIYAAAEGTTPSIVSDANRNFLLIERLAGPNQISATEQIVARYTKSDASAFNGGAVRLFGNKVADTHGAYNTSTGLFTAPIAGFYHIDAAVQAASASYSAGGNARLYFSAAGSTVWGAEHISEAAFTGTKMLTASQTVYLLAGQTLGVATDASPAVNFAADATRNSLAIFLVK